MWAKAPKPEQGGQRCWSPLHTHLTDTGAVVRLIWDEWLGQPAGSVVAADCGGDQDVAREVAALAGALHDIGKATRAFAGQVPEMKAEMVHRGGFTWSLAACDEDSRKLPHALAGQVIVERFLAARGVPAANARAFGVIVGGHHGVPPTGGELHVASAATRYLGHGEWDDARFALVDHVITRLGLEDAVESLRTVRLSDASQMLLSALVVMADWIASNAEYFPLVPAWRDSDDDPNVRARRGWDALALPRPWRATAESLTADPSDLLRTRFGVDFDANDVQLLAVESARAMPEPGLLLIEAVMGVGKTEASLLAAEVLAARFGFSGVFYGLPTRATADAMFLRVLRWWENLPGEDEGDRGVALRHGTASLNEAYRGLPRRRPTTTARSAENLDDDAPLASDHYVDIGRDVDAPVWAGRHGAPGGVVAHHWTSGRKQASFADSVIATIDHELLAALSSRHVVLRHLGLARQVVVLDEIHAADTWMFVYLARALEWLARYGVPVIAMSATLAPDQRRQLVEAYEKGRRARVSALAEESAVPRDAAGLVQPRFRRAASPMPEIPELDDYPRLTTLAGGVVTTRNAPPGAARGVDVEWLSGDHAALVKAVEPVLTAGGCVLVVRNTVRRAVETYRELRRVWGESVSLTHSRFVAFDRLRNDDWLRETFGPGDDGDRAGRIVVATQVAEQSLDVDFDLLVTDLAPIDLVLQRIGRLQRHAGRSRPAAASRPRCLVAGLEPSPSADVVPTPERGSTAVYGAHHLLRTAALLAEYDGRPLDLPTDVPVLVRRCYGAEPLGPATWQNAMTEAERDFRKAQSDAEHNATVYRLRAPGEASSLLGLLANETGEAETSTGIAKQVRQADGGFEVVLLVNDQDGLRLLPQFEDDRPLHRDVPPNRETERLLARSMVRVPGWVVGNESWTDQVLNDLSENYFREWQKSPVLGGQLILLLSPELTGRMGPFIVTYDAEVGLGVEK
ncbi:CRISPR-associated Cas3 family helicase [Salana multivorans]|uniref:CRISPR-associated Cas3 family helicase n=1 Tax=Salana multivorans TaxID=120377 RepID=A0A3N2DAU5_9MICO|nr:CRISPR-associated Cas3 family helicase [Salana multivorans]